ncbi:hypothetical protein [Streptomyces sp. ML-6]|uniref:hypothetical protein n=1 Tax=Streptomyces sp. ML-6 TaxID=2982693 RepID=UPI0024BF5F19|nr:hypothetical protein [Streptomyces sp. ML-6]MDK0519727.1 hypothetical protein [Streptomyces sp. ML-6]
MPHPTAAQFSYGSVTVVFSTLAMLLLSRTESGAGITVIGTAALALGLLVAMTVPNPSRAKTTKPVRTGAATGANHDAVTAAMKAEGLTREATGSPVREVREAGQRSGTPADGQPTRPSLRR